MRTAVLPQDQQWFYSVGGERFGPVGFDYLLELSQSGGLDPRNDLVWTTTLSDWEPAGEIEGLFERKAVERRDDELMGGEGGMLSQTGEYVSPTLVSKGHATGVGRLGFVFGILILPIIIGIAWGVATPLVSPMVPVDYQEYLPLVAGILAGLLALIFTVKRFRNLGMSGWWAIGTFVPFLNLWLFYRCLACPAGYSGVRRLDGIGKLLAVLYWGSLLVVGGLTVALVVSSLGELKDSGTLGEWINQFKELRSSAVPER